MACLGHSHWLFVAVPGVGSMLVIGQIVGSWCLWRFQRLVVGDDMVRVLTVGCLELVGVGV